MLGLGDEVQLGEAMFMEGDFCGPLGETEGECMPIDTEPINCGDLTEVVEGVPALDAVERSG